MPNGLTNWTLVWENGAKILDYKILKIAKYSATITVTEVFNKIPLYTGDPSLAHYYKFSSYSCCYWLRRCRELYFNTETWSNSDKIHWENNWEWKNLDPNGRHFNTNISEIKTTVAQNNPWTNRILWSINNLRVANIL